MATDTEFRSKTFFDSTVTYGWLLDKLQENDPEYKKYTNGSSVDKIEYVEIGAGEGYLSKVLKVDVYCKNSTNCYSVVLKIPCLSSGIKEMMGKNREQYEQKFWEHVTILHRNECNFYSKFSKYDIRMPKVYGTEEINPTICDGALLMEYLTDKAICIKRGLSFNYLQVMSLATEFAKLVAISLTLGKKIDDYIMQSDPKMLQFIKDAVEELMKDNTGFYGDSITRLFPLFDDDFVAYFFTSIHDKLGTKPVLNHGDVWGNNMMFKKNEKNEAGDEVYALIDWQVIHAGTIARDLASVLVIGTDRSVRRQFEQNGLSVFYQLVEKKFHSLCDEVMPITFEQFKLCYYQEFLRSTMLFAVYLKTLTKKPANPPDPDEVEKRCQMVRQRMKDAADDAYDIIKKHFPEWLPVQNIDMKDDEVFADTPYSCAWLKNFLKKQDPHFRSRLAESKIKKVEYKKVKNDDGWLNSKTLRVQIHFDDSEAPYVIRVKIPAVTSSSNCLNKMTKNQLFLECQNAQCRFLESCKDTPALQIPRVFFTEAYSKATGNGIIVSEDLCDKGILLDHLQSFSKNQIKAVIEQIARLIVESIKLGRKYVDGYPSMAHRITSAIETLKSITQHPEDPLNISSILDEVRQLYKVEEFNDLLRTNFGSELVLCHGNIQKRNVFWKKDSKGCSSNHLLAISDWNFVQKGSIGRDLCNLLITCADSQLRHEIEEEMFVFLHSSIKNLLEAEKRQITFTAAQIKACYRKEFLYQALLATAHTIAFEEIDARRLYSPESVKDLHEKRMKCLKSILEDALLIVRGN